MFASTKHSLQRALTAFLITVVVFVPSGEAQAPCPEKCQSQIDALKKEIEVLKQAVAALQTTAQPWETSDVNDVNKATLLAVTLKGQGGIFIITLKQLTNVGGTGVRLDVEPPVQILLSDGGIANLNIPTILDQRTKLRAGGCTWVAKLNSHTLTMDPSQCMYPKGYGAAFNIQSAR
jgi:hypothetical protein